MSCTNRCTGGCCENFHLFTKESLADRTTRVMSSETLSSEERDLIIIKSAIIFKEPDDEFSNLNACNYFDIEKKECMIYDLRPNFCRIYPDNGRGDKCPIKGCTYTDKYDSIVELIEGHHFDYACWNNVYDLLDTEPSLQNLSNELYEFIRGQHLRHKIYHKTLLKSIISEKRSKEV